MVKAEASIFNHNTSHLQTVPMMRPTTPCISCTKVQGMCERNKSAIPPECRIIVFFNLTHISS